MGGLSFLLKGGFMMYPLLLSGVIALTVIIERSVVIRTKFLSPDRLVEDTIRQYVAESRGGQISEALRDKLKNMDSPVASVLAAGLHPGLATSDDMEQAMQLEAESWVPKLERRLDILDTVITAAPLMGLLGTITGMMASFKVLSENGVNEPTAITGGVAEALIATATGLVIALVCLMAYNYFNNFVKNTIFDMENAGARLLEARRRT